MKAKILIVGGYGSVDRLIATSLGNQFPSQITATGRNFQQVRALSLETRREVLLLAEGVSL